MVVKGGGGGGGGGMAGTPCGLDIQIIPTPGILTENFYIWVRY